CFNRPSRSGKNPTANCVRNNSSSSQNSAARHPGRPQRRSWQSCRPAVVTEVAFVPRGNRWVLVGDREVTLWDPQSRKTRVLDLRLEGPGAGAVVILEGTAI